MHTVHDFRRCQTAIFFVSAILFVFKGEDSVATESSVAHDAKAAGDRRMAEQALKNWDTNGDKGLDVHEVLKVPGPGRVVKLWFLHDLNKDGQLTVEELVRVWAVQRGATPPVPAADLTAASIPEVRSSPRVTLHLNDEMRLTKFSPDGLHLAAAGETAIHVLDAETGKVRHRIRGHNSRVSSVSFSPNGQTLFTASRDGTARFWNVVSGDSVGTKLRHDRPLFWGQFTPDGKAVVTAPDDNARTTVDVWAVPDGPRTLRLRGATGTINRLAFSPDGKLLASAEWDRNGVNVWDFQTGELLWSRKHSSHAVCVEFSPDGKTLATGGWDNLVRFWKADDGKFLRSIRPGSAPVETILWWPDSRWLLTGSRDGRIAVLDTRTGKIEQRFSAHSVQVRGLDLSRDTKTLASCSTDKTLKLWEMRLRPQ